MFTGDVSIENLPIVLASEEPTPIPEIPSNTAEVAPVPAVPSTSRTQRAKIIKNRRNNSQSVKNKYYITKLQCAKLQLRILNVELQIKKEQLKQLKKNKD